MDKVDDILRELKRNVDGTRQVLQQWEENLLFERKADRTYSFADLREEFDKSVSARHAVINDNGKAIGKNVSSSYRTLVVRPEPADWKAYTDYVSNIVIDGFARGIVASLDYLTGQLLVRYLLIFFYLSACNVQKPWLCAMSLCNCASGCCNCCPPDAGA